MKKVDPTTIEDLMSQLQSLPAVQLPRRPAAAIKELAPAIESALARGQDIETIRRMLEQHGITLQPNSLRAYLRKARAQAPLAAAPPPAQAPSTTPTLRADASAVAEPHAPRLTASSAEFPRRPRNGEQPLQQDAESTKVDARAAPRGHFQPKPDSSDI